jgi:hypothetical protein
MCISPDQLHFSLYVSSVSWLKRERVRIECKAFRHQLSRQGRVGHDLKVPSRHLHAAGSEEKRREPFSQDRT